MIVECPKIEFQNAKITGDSVDPRVHHKQEFKRGDHGFVMSRGELMEFAECPAKWITRRGADEQTSFMQWGDLIDCMFLTADQFDSRFAIAPENYTVQMMKCPQCESITDSQSCRKCKTNREPVSVDKPWDWNATYCQEWKQAHADKATIKSDTYRQALHAVGDRLSYCSEVTHATAAARFQISLSAEYFDPATELTIPIRALVDIAPAGGDCANSLVDLKTTNSAAPRDWERKVSDDHLDAQATLYLDLWKAATGEERSDFRHIVQESSPPYHIELRILSQEFIELGRIKYRSALLKYCQCLATNTWPGYEAQGRMTFGRWQLCQPEAWMIGQAA